VAIGEEVGALLLADVAHIAGLIAGGVSQNPLDVGFHVLTTTTHKSLRGPRGGMILSRGTVGNPLSAPEKTIENMPTLIDRAVFPGMQGGPHMNVIAAKAVAFHEALQPEFQIYVAQIVANARRLASELTERGFQLITGGTDNHLILADVQASFGIDGKTVEQVLDRVGLTLNANSIPDDELPPFRPSGIRLGTPALTTKGMIEDDMPLLADWMIRAIVAKEDEPALEQIHREVVAFVEKL